MTTARGLSLGLASLLATGAAGAPSENWMSDGVISFESAGVPPEVRLSGGGTLSTSTRRFIHGSRSLRWDWRGGDRLVFSQPIDFATQSEARRRFGAAALSTLHLFIYNERAVSDGKLRVEFATGGADAPTDCHFEMGLNFTGWRKATPAFARDMKGTPKPGMDTIRLIAPTASGGGVFYLDQVIPGIVNDPRFQWPDWQLPGIGPRGAPGIPAAVPDEPPTEIPTQAQADLDLIASRLEGVPQRHSPGAAEALRNRVERLGVIEDAYGIRGAHIITSYEHDMLPDALARQVLSGEAGYVTLGEYGRLMLDVAEAWRAAPDPSSRRPLASLYGRLARHLIDQGWTEGSSLGTTHHFGYQSRDWCRSVFLMRGPLAEAGLLAPMSRALEWYSREFIRLDAPAESRFRGDDMDCLNTIVATQMMISLMHAAPSVRESRIRTCAAHLASVFALPKHDLGSGFKVDGTAFHHGGHYPGYAYPGIIGAANLAWILRGTHHALPEASLATLKEAVRAARFAGNPQTGTALAGRHPFNENSAEELGEAAVRLVEAGATPDLDFASIAVALNPAGAKRIAAACAAAVSPAAGPQGHRVFNYGCFAIHRDGERMVTLKGFNRHVWSSEIYTKDNRYGRYPSNGTIQIVKTGPNAASGFVQDGWDWNRFPGATSRRLPLELLESPLRHTLMLRSDKSFCGGSSLEGCHGAFAMQLWEPAMERFDPAFSGLKSVFCFGDRLVCLGSGIRSSDMSHPVETTLFQHALAASHPPVWAGAPTPVTEFPFTRRLAPPTWLVDGHGNGYVVRSGPDVLCERRRQESRHNKTKSPTSGDFAAAVLDHGAAPADAGYEYAVLLGATPGRTAAFAVNPPYTVLRRDAALHAVRDHATGVTAYVAFRAGDLAARDLLSISTPCIVMTRETPEGLRVSVGDPDLNIPKDGEARPKTLAITLRGARRLAAADPRVTARPEPDSTALTVTVRDGLPVEFLLKPEPAFR